MLPARDEVFSQVRTRPGIFSASASDMLTCLNLSRGRLLSIWLPLPQTLKPKAFWMALLTPVAHRPWLLYPPMPIAAARPAFASLRIAAVAWPGLPAPRLSLTCPLPFEPPLRPPPPDPFVPPPPPPPTPPFPPPP